VDNNKENTLNVVNNDIVYNRPKRELNTDIMMFLYCDNYALWINTQKGDNTD